jgi:hypothetical protein
VNFTEKLKEILVWIASHTQRLSRKGLDLPNHLAYARVYFFETDSQTPVSTYADAAMSVQNNHPIVLDSEGKVRPSVFLKSDQRYRVEVKDNIGELLFTQDDIRGDQFT